MLQGFAEVVAAGFQLSEQTDVLQSYRGLVGESLDELYLGGSERLDLASAATDDTDRPGLPQDRHPEE